MRVKSPPRTAGCLNGSTDVACARGGTVNTGQRARRNTFSVTDPRTRCSNPLSPWVPITMRSAGRLAAQSRIGRNRIPGLHDYVDGHMVRPAPPELRHNIIP